MKFQRSSMMVLSIAILMVLVFLGAQLQISTAFALPRVHGPKVFATPDLTSSHTWTLGTNACLGSGCHVSNGSPGSAAVTGFPAGMTYTPGTPIPLTVTINDRLGPRFGFELTARLASNTATAAGRWAAGTNSNLHTDVVPVVQGLASTNTFNFTWTPPATASGSVNFYLTGWSGSFPDGDAYTAMYTLTPAAAATPDFSLSGSATSLAATQGGTSGADTITVTPKNGFTGSVTLSTSTLPTGVTAKFGTNPTTGTSALAFTASSTAATGTTSVTITGMSGTLSHTTTVSLTVNAAAPLSSISASPSNLTFNYQQGSAAPGSQPIMVSGSPAGLTYNAAPSGATWLSIDSTSGKVPGMINATASPGTLPPGTYTGGKVTITSTGATGSPQTANVTLVITAATTTSSLTATPTSLHFSYTLGGAAPPSRNLSIGATGGKSLSFAASYSGGTWVTLKPTTGTTAATISVSVTPGTMASGTYNGTISISAPGVTTLSVPVTLTINGPSGGETSGSMYAQPYVHDPTSSGGVSAQWVNRLGDSTQYNNPALVLSVSASAPSGSWAGVHILNVSGPLTEIGYDYRFGSECTTTSPRFLVVTTDAVTHVVGGCSVAGATVQTDAPTKGWTRVRFNLADPTQTNPVVTPGMQVQSITLVMDQGPESAPGASGGLAVIDNVDVNGTLITSGTNYSHDD